MPLKHVLDESEEVKSQDSNENLLLTTLYVHEIPNAVFFFALPLHSRCMLDSAQSVNSPQETILF